MNVRSRVNYLEYIQSLEWAAKRRRALDRAGHRCQLCSSRKKLEVHHNTYENLGDERDEDLTVLCDPCHEVFHAKRDERTAKKYREAEWVQKWKDRAYAALPEKPSPSLAQPPLATPKAPKKKFEPNYKNGKMVTMAVTSELVQSLCYGNPGMTTYAGLRLLGEPVPWRNGWRTGCVGRIVTIDEGELLAHQEIAAAKRNGSYARPKFGVREELTPDQIAAIRAEYATDKTCGKKSLASKWGRSRTEIAIIIQDLVNDRHKRKT